MTAILPLLSTETFAWSPVIVSFFPQIRFHFYLFTILQESSGTGLITAESQPETHS